MTNACYNCTHRAALVRMERGANTAIISLGLLVGALFSFGVMPMSQYFVVAGLLSVGLSTAFWGSAAYLQPGTETRWERISGLTGWAATMAVIFAAAAWAAGSNLVGFNFVYAVNIVLVLKALSNNCE